MANTINVLLSTLFELFITQNTTRMSYLIIMFLILLQLLQSRGTRSIIEKTFLWYNLDPY